MSARTYPFDLEYVQKRGMGLTPVTVPRVDDRYILGIGLSSRCNFQCPICYYHAPDGEISGQDMDIGLLTEILSSLPRLARIVIGLEGEPLLHKQFFKAISIMAKHANELVLITNASLLTEEYSKFLLHFSLPYILLSIDAADAENYARFRRGGNFDQFLRNVEAALALGHKAVLHATVFRENLGTLLELPALAHRLGLNCISLQQLRAHPGSARRGMHPTGQQELEDWFARLVVKASIHNIQIMPDRFFGGPEFHAQLCAQSLRENLLLVEKMPQRQCPHAENFAGIMADGSLFPCAGDYAPVPLESYSFDTIFNHPYLQKLRAFHRYGVDNPACTICMNKSEALS